MTQGEEMYVLGTIRDLNPTSLVESMCGSCGGLIGEPGKVYGYAGRWCHCFGSSRRSLFDPVETDSLIRRAAEQKEKEELAKKQGEQPKANPPISSLPMTPHEFVYWMRGFFSSRYGTPADPALEAVLRGALDRVRT